MDIYEALTDRLELFARMSAAFSLLALLFIMSLVSVPYPLNFAFEAPLLLMALYYWSVFRPTLLPPWLVFAAGLLFDLIAGAPLLGLTAILFLLARLAVIDQRRFLTGQGFFMVWFGFCLLNALFHITQWAVLSLFNMSVLSWSGVLEPFILGGVLFPVVQALLHITHKILPDAKMSSKSTLRSQKSGMSL